VHKNNQGLTGRQKLALQFTASLAVAVALVVMQTKGMYSTRLVVPFMKNFRPNLIIDSVRHVPHFGWVAFIPFVIFVMIVIAGASNAVNLTDGLDGLAIGCTIIAAAAQDIPSSQLLGTKGMQYDAKRFNWLGAVVASNSIVYTWHAAGIKSWEDAKAKPVFLATTDVSTMAVPRAMNALLGTKFQLVPGYAGTGEIKLALERGEMMGSGGTTWAGLTISSQDLIAGHLIDLLIQTGPRKEPDLPAVPLFTDVVQSEEAKEIATIVSLPNAIGYAHWVAPDVPADRVAILRDAYVATMHDPDFLAEAAKEKLLVRPQTAEDIAARVKEAFATPQPVLSRTVEILNN